MTKTYTIEIANRISKGRAVGTDYVVTRRQVGNSGIIARFSTRAEAEAFIEKAPATFLSFDRNGNDCLMTVPAQQAADLTRCPKEQTDKSQGRECFRRCSLPPGHESDHRFGNWCLR